MFLLNNIFHNSNNKMNSLITISSSTRVDKAGVLYKTKVKETWTEGSPEGGSGQNQAARLLWPRRNWFPTRCLTIHPHIIDRTRLLPHRDQNSWPFIHGVGHRSLDHTWNCVVLISKSDAWGDKLESTLYDSEKMEIFYLKFDKGCFGHK